MLTGTTKNLAVIGWPIAHSLSPVLQNAAIEKAGLDYVYTALPVKPEDLPAAVQGLKALQFRGWNVTIPHKTAIMPLLDAIDEDARIIGAVNTVVNDEGCLTGYNTDVTGFIEALLAAGFAPQDKTAVLLGAGGAARAVVWGLIKAGVTAIHIGVRSPKKVQPLVDEFSTYGTLTVSHWEQADFAAKLAAADLLVNTTPLGMFPQTNAMPPVDWSNVKADAFVYDIIYTPAETRLLREARLHGHPTLNGEDMLVGQGAAAFSKWTGVQPDIECMKVKLREALAT
ncbi:MULTISPECIES: shikimate dehydrogenase [Selenomonas]|uniref:Shikimate dehydrogenase (NADP(+)) n=1 Tax=Selenomonas ruminis TaxID=2593411 RepID=A0A5D6W9S0_9FIRM|nr:MULTISPECIES: shikimate dehydrogenase [unclassified Selenomonas]MBQ1868385.1 shikimate dehydrogenase [Selenomonas sp.]TYZ24677.1 shikimate dehydrogenase [Selenomonas sp. mPRGC5]